MCDGICLCCERDVYFLFKLYKWEWEWECECIAWRMLELLFRTKRNLVLMTVTHIYNYIVSCVALTCDECWNCDYV
jgi:hypothetical protein